MPGLGGPAELLLPSLPVPFFDGLLDGLLELLLLGKVLGAAFLGGSRRRREVLGPGLHLLLVGPVGEDDRVVLDQRVDDLEDLGHVLHHGSSILVGSAQQLRAEHGAEVALGHAVDFGVDRDPIQEHDQLVQDLLVGQR